MIKRRKVIYNFVYYDEVELIKTFPIPFYIGKMNDMSVSIVFHADERSLKLPSCYKGVHLCPLKFKSNGRPFSFKGEWYFFWYFFLYAKDIDVLIRPHFSYQTAIIGWIYKFRNPHGKFYIFSEGYGVWRALFRNESKKLIKLKNIIIKKILYKTCEIADKVSIELTDIYEFYKLQSPFSKNPDKLILMRWGIDEEALLSYNIQELSVNNKEKLIISVGRHGSKQKNTELFLNALKSVDLKDYSVVFIGPIEENECDFQDYIDDFFEMNVDLKSKISFIGAIYNKKELYAWFNRAKIFVHTSIYESYGIVLGEAFRFNNYIISTDVGCAKELVARGMGQLIAQNDISELSFCLQQVIDDKINIASIFEKKKIDNQSFSWENEIAKLGCF